MQPTQDITNNDTLPFTNRFNYIVKEMSYKDFILALTKIKAEYKEDLTEDSINNFAYLLRA